MARKPAPPDPTQHAAVWPRLASQLFESAQTVTITQHAGETLTWRQAHALKQQFRRYVASLRRAVVAGDSKWEPAMIQAKLIVTRVERLPFTVTVQELHSQHEEPAAAISFYNRDRSPWAQTVESALSQIEAL